ncbi:MAG: cation:proton antiporter [Candidatus Zixiibacteriota bacterium]|nr:MAG: cation:proton antiporter [candidate division Zixibacteria bacterium]
MDELVYLRDLVVILGFGAIIVAVFQRFRLPSIAGFILSGIIVGPESLGLINDVHQVEVLAEIGVALLLFGIGLELSLDKLRRLWKLILAGGILQVGLSILVAFAISKFYAVPDRSALFIGFLVALSSTAIVLRGLQQRGEVDAPHGRLTLGILVFQDFSVVPMMLAIPILSGTDIHGGQLLGTLLESLVIVAGVLLAARLIVPRVLDYVARTRQRQLFILTIFLICIGTAWLITSSGASLAIGAFLAGLVVAGGEYRHQALADLIPFREIFTSLFFISVGMLLAPRIIIENIVPILVIVAALVAGKSAVVFVSALALRMSLRVSLLAALALAQVGEFSLVLLFAAQGTDLIDISFAGIFISGAILTMFLTPFAMSLGPHVAAGVGKLRGLTRLLEVATAEEAADVVRNLRNHVIIGGYGFAGRQLVQALKECQIPFVIADLNVENVRKASREAGNAYFGDITSDEVLSRLGAEQAGELVILINDSGAVEHAVRAARRLAPDLSIIVRTNYLLDVEPLLAAGADDVIPAEREAAAEVTSRVLNKHRVASQSIGAHCAQIRSQRKEENEQF